MLFVRDEVGFDGWLTDSERLVRLHTAYTSPERPPFLTVRSAGKMKDALVDYAKNEIESATHLIPYSMTVRKNNEAFSEEVTFVDGTFFELFNLPFIHGSKDTSFSKPSDLVLTKNMALKYFGKTDVVGETLTLCCFQDNVIPLIITGVVDDIPEASHFKPNLIVRIEPRIFNNIPGVLDTWTSVNVYTYFKMKEGVTLAQLQERIFYWVNNESPFLETSQQQTGYVEGVTKVTDSIKHRVMRVPDLHLKAKDYAGTMGDLTPMGDGDMINTFIIVAILILLIACINFMNLATARAGQRAREVAMRKVLGASRSQVAIQFLSEAIVLVMIALFFAMVIVELVLPLYNHAVGRELQFQITSDVGMLFTLITIAVLVGIGAGIYPALYLSRYLPAYILKSSKGAESSSTSRLRTVLVVFQFSVSIALVASTGVIYSQTNYANSIDVGYKYKDKMILNISNSGDSRDSLKHELLSLPEITSVVYSSEAPSQDFENNTFFKLLEQQGNSSANQRQLFNYHNMGYGFFEAYQVKPLAGRLFDKKFGSDTIIETSGDRDAPGNASVILNESALKKLGFTSPEQAIGKTLEGTIYRSKVQHLKIIGVIPDIYFRSIKFSVRPSVYTLRPERFRVASLSFQTNDLPALISKVEGIWKNHVPYIPISVDFLSEMMAAQYESEVIEAKLFSTFSLLAIIIACLGLYGLAAFTAQRRTMEIGLRKVMGARIWDIITLLTLQFSIPVVLANIIAWPLVIYTMTLWLERFPYRIESIWLFVICLAAGLISIIIAWITVGGYAAKVARANPIRALRHE